MQRVVPGWQRSFLADHEGGSPVSGRGLDSAVFWLYKGEGTCKTRSESYNTPFKNNISKTQNTGHVLFSSHFILASHRGLNKSFKRQNKRMCDAAKCWEALSVGVFSLMYSVDKVLFGWWSCGSNSFVYLFFFISLAQFDSWHHCRHFFLWSEPKRDQTQKIVGFYSFPIYWEYFIHI